MITRAKLHVIFGQWIISASFKKDPFKPGFNEKVEKVSGYPASYSNYSSMPQSDSVQNKLNGSNQEDVPAIYVENFMKALSKRRDTWMVDWILALVELDPVMHDSLYHDFREHWSIKKLRETLSILQTKMVLTLS